MAESDVRLLSVALADVLTFRTNKPDEFVAAPQWPMPTSRRHRKPFTTSVTAAITAILAARSAILTIAAFMCFTVAAWLIWTPFGFGTAGVSLLCLEFLTGGDDPDGEPGTS